MGLFTPAWNSKNPEKRIKAVKKITEIEKLQRIAEKTDYEDVQQEVWKRIVFDAKSLEYLDLRKAAVKKITDEITLARVALNVEDSSICETAMEKIHHPVLLAKIALSEILKDSNVHVRKAAIEKLTDQTCLKEVVLNATNSQVRIAALKKLTSQAILKEIALKDSDSDIRKYAVEKLTDQEILSYVIKNDKVNDVRKAAVKNMTNQPALVEIACEDENSDIRELAVENITDKKLLNDIVKNCKYTDITIKAAQVLKDDQFIEEIAKNAPNDYIKFKAYSSLSYLDDVFVKKLALIRECRTDGKGASRYERQATVKNLIEIMSKNKRMAALCWNEVEKVARTTHHDWSQCSFHDDCGMGMDNFPAYPFND